MNKAEFKRRRAGPHHPPTPPLSLLFSAASDGSEARFPSPQHHLGELPVSHVLPPPAFTIIVRMCSCASVLRRNRRAGAHAALLRSPFTLFK